MGMNQKLAHLYEDYFVNIQPILDEELLEFSTPLLLKVSETYENAKLKVMIVGQETYEFYGKYGAFLQNHSSVEYAQDIYTKFVKEESENYHSPFWDYINRLSEGSGFSWIWNNVFKLETVEYLSDEKYLGEKVSLSELNTKKKYRHYRHLIDKIKLLQKDIFLKELEILKPDVVIFFTGHPYDSLFMDWQFDTQNDFYQDIPEALKMGIDKWKFGRLSSPLLPVKTFRTYHPNYLRRASGKVLSKEQKEFIFTYLRQQVDNVKIFL